MSDAKLTPAQLRFLLWAVKQAPNGRFAFWPAGFSRATIKRLEANKFITKVQVERQFVQHWAITSSGYLAVEQALQRATARSPK